MSGKRNGESSNGAAEKKKMQKRSGAKSARKHHRASDVGRALRSIYDDTLREAVPDDFKDLLGKLS